MLTFDEERRLLEAAAPHVRPFIVVAINTGLRLSELTGLQWSDVDFTSNRVTLRATKSRKVQTVPLNRHATEVLLTLRGLGRVGPVFTFEGQRLDNPKKALAAAARRAGIGKVTCHMFRHTCQCVCSKLAWISGTYKLGCVTRQSRRRRATCTVQTSRTQPRNSPITPKVAHASNGVEKQTT